ncbi:Uncharacterised protein [Suttonella ornithocola]|uniref:Uncharacterized protein n=1 Tax=Suttonella ornithocola TaxID=279832 RepID=A0A380MM71_9GAMM|nr:Uncharacterised protein [Suttonella ornithocola]
MTTDTNTNSKTQPDARTILEFAHVQVAAEALFDLQNDLH